MGAQPPQHHEAGVDIDWATTETYFLKEVRPPVPPVRPLALHPPCTAVTETAATKDIDAGKMLFPHISCFTVHVRYFSFKTNCVPMLPVIPARSPTAASQATSDLSCHDGEERAVVVMTEIEAVEVEREAVEEGEKPTEEDGTLLDYTEPLFFRHGSLFLRE